MPKLQSKSLTHSQESIRKRKFWLSIMSEWKQNPISPREFCKIKNLVTEQFYYWRRKCSEITSGDGDFVEVPVITKNKDDFITNVSSTVDETASIEIIVPSGIRLSIKLPVSAIKEVVNQFGGITC